MDVHEFCSMLGNDIKNFEKNMLSEIDNPKIQEWHNSLDQEGWMDAFLRWMEWKTDMHDEYWK